MKTTINKIIDIEAALVQKSTGLLTKIYDLSYTEEDPINKKLSDILALFESTQGGSTGNVPNPGESDSNNSTIFQYAVFGSIVPQANGGYQRIDDINNAPAYKHVENQFYIYKWNIDDVWMLSKNTNDPDPGTCLYYGAGNASADITSIPWQDSAFKSIEVRSNFDISTVQTLVISGGTNYEDGEYYLIDNTTGFERIWYGPGRVLYYYGTEWYISYNDKNHSSANTYCYGDNPYGNDVTWFYQGQATNMKCLIK